MSPRGFLGLLVITLIAAGAAVAMVVAQPGIAPVRQVNEPAFEELRSDPDATAKVILTTNAGSFTLLRETADHWVAMERFGYAVDSAKVRELIVALADMRLIEAKTSRADRHARLELEDPGAEDARSRQLRLETADGSLLAEAIIGKQRQRATGNQGSGTYLRRPGEAQSWLASGGLRLDENVVDWLDHQIVDLDGARLRQIDVRPLDGEAYTIERAMPGGPLALAGSAAGETASAANLGRLAGALSSLRLEDVRPRADLLWPETLPSITFTTFDGLELTVELATIEGTDWLRLDARAVASVAPDPVAPDPMAADPMAANDDVADDGVADDAAAAISDEDAAAAAVDAPAEAVAEALPDAAALNQRLGNWAFQVPDWVRERLTTTRAALLEGGDGAS
jgi:hypothetical protein